MLAFEQFRISFRTGGAFVLVDDQVPLLDGIQVFVSVAQHLVHGAIGEILRLRDVVEADADGGVLEDRTKKSLPLLQGLLGTLACRDVLRQTDNVLRLAGCIPEQLKSAVANNNAAVTPNEAL